jgi:hypothetical protein
MGTGAEESAEGEAFGVFFEASLFVLVLLCIPPSLLDSYTCQERRRRRRRNEEV